MDYNFCKDFVVCALVDRYTCVSYIVMFYKTPVLYIGSCEYY